MNLDVVYKGGFSVGRSCKGGGSIGWMSGSASPLGKFIAISSSLGLRDSHLPS